MLGGEEARPPLRCLSILGSEPGYFPVHPLPSSAQLLVTGSASGTRTDFLLRRGSIVTVVTRHRLGAFTEASLTFLLHTRLGRILLDARRGRISRSGARCYAILHRSGIGTRSCPCAGRGVSARSGLGARRAVPA